jgi:hypothetical protein
MAVRQHQRLDAIPLQLAQVGDDQVHPQQVGLREHDARVDENRRLATGDDHHVHAEFAEPAERDQLQSIGQIDEIPACGR